MAFSIRAAILHDGFSVVAVMSPCPTYFGRKNKLGCAVEMMKRMKEINAHRPMKERAAFVSQPD